MVLVSHCCAMSFISNFAQITKHVGSVPNVDIKADAKEYETNNNNQLSWQLSRYLNTCKCGCSAISILIFDRLNWP